jgi:hypothetical protein
MQWNLTWTKYRQLYTATSSEPHIGNHAMQPHLNPISATTQCNSHLNPISATMQYSLTWTPYRQLHNATSPEPHIGNYAMQPHLNPISATTQCNSHLNPISATWGASWSCYFSSRTRFESLWPHDVPYRICYRYPYRRRSYTTQQNLCSIRECFK